MAFNPGHLEAAAKAQAVAASDENDQVRLIAGPGTGKSKTIEERVCFLLESGVSASAITAVSFTRAAALDLQGRVHAACRSAGHDPDELRVTTLHSLALRALKMRGALEAYPVDPQVLDSWEIDVFDQEFGQSAGIGSIPRRRWIREDREAFWSTGKTEVRPSHEPPSPPINDDERGKFEAFHGPRTQLYACVLPGEIVQKCVSMMEAGTLNPVDLLGLQHVIVDEYQDLNPMDQRFVRWLAEHGVKVFAAGDDDQSLYSFRYAAPEGIQRFTSEFPDAGDHGLEHCFRCAPAVLEAAETLIAANAAPGRIPKHHVSMYADADPPLRGGVGGWSFYNDDAEARAIAESCKKLIDAGMRPRQIMVLLSNARALAAVLNEAFDAAGVPHESPRETPLNRTDTGRALFVALRLAGRPDDYVALRSLFALRKGIGIGTASAIGEIAIAERLNYRHLFFDGLPADVFNKRQTDALEHARGVAEELATWSQDDLLAERADALDALIPDILGADPDLAWRDELAVLPAEATLAEAVAFLRTEKADDQAEVVAAVRRRLGEEVAVDEALPDNVRVMTMHGAKGLSAQVVFIPALEEELLPGEKRKPYPGLVLEAARMLYVSITRARAACIFSFANRRYRHGSIEAATPSRFTANLGVTFKLRTEPMGDESVAKVIEAIEKL